MDTNIEYKINSSGEILPITPQSGGVLGDDNTVTLSVDLSAITVLENEYIRIDIANGSGGFYSSEHLSLANGKVTYKLPYEVTIAGGTAQAHLVIVQYDGDVRRVRYSFPMRIYFKDSTAGTAGNARYSQELSGLMLKAADAAENANRCSAAAQSLAEESKRQAASAASAADSAANSYRSAADAAVRSKGYADSIIESAESAAASAEAALSYAQAADSMRGSAASSAENAAASAESASNYAQAAASMRDSAASSADNAAASAESARNYASAAASMRDSAASSADNAAASAAGAASAVIEHNADTDAHGGIRNTIALLQKYPCYEYNTSGGNVQRFDDVSVIPHNIGITVHGATNGVINPTVCVYGKNLLPISGWDEKVNLALGYKVIAGVTYTFSIYATYSSKTTGLYGFSLKIQESGTDLIAKGGQPINNRVSVTFTATESGTLYYNGYNTISCKELQLEVGGTATEYEPYKGEQTVTLTTSLPDGVYITIDTFTSVSPNMTVIESNYNNVVNQVDVKYNADLMKRIATIEAAIAAQA